MNSNSVRIVWLGIAWLAVTVSAAGQMPAVAPADTGLASARPVPRWQVVPQPYQQASVQRDGREVTRYHFGSDLYRPFLFPVIGPSGRSVTRMGHPHDPNGHSHHNSVWVSHHDVNGIDFWGDSGQGRIVQRKVLRYDDGEDGAVIAVQNAWMDGAGKSLLDEQRILRFVPLPELQWLLVLDLQFTASKEPVIFGKTPFGLVGVRMAKTIGVHDGGGRILNSAGEINERGVFWKQAKWVDYSGNLTPAAAAGITLMDHPANPNHPTHFHVRDDGWMGASLTFAAPLPLTPGTPLKLRYGLFVHAGAPASTDLDRHFDLFSQLPAAAEQKP